MRCRCCSCGCLYASVVEEKEAMRVVDVVDVVEGWEEAEANIVDVADTVNVAMVDALGL